MDAINLHRIAVEAMRSRGLLPAFAPQALQEAEAARRSGPERDGTIHDLRHLTWFSIDNDDTRDLDQLSVAEALAIDRMRLVSCGPCQAPCSDRSAFGGRPKLQGAGRGSPVSPYARLG